MGDLFRWRAPDGREVLLHHLSPDGYEAGSALPADPAALVPAWKALKARIDPRSRSPHVAVFVGADHHAAHPAIGALRDLLAELEPEAEVLVSRLGEYFDAASTAAEDAPLVEGELRWSYGYTWTLQGTHATRAPLKRLHAEAELSLERIAEPLAALAQVHRGLELRPLLDHAWRTLLRSQFHDSICGCSSDAVAERVAARLGDARSMAAELARASLNALGGNDPDVARDHPGATAPSLVWLNPAARRRSGVVIAELSWFRRDVLVGPPGDRVPRREGAPTDRDVAAALGGLPFQVLGRRRTHERLDSARHYPDQDEVEIVRVALAAPELDGFELSSGPVSAGRPGPVSASGLRLNNQLIEVELGADGLVTLTDRRSGARYSRLLALETEGDAGDTYSFAPAAGDGPHRTRWTAAHLLAAGPLVGAIEARASLRSGQVHARIVLAVHAGSPLLRCTLELENAAPDQRLRIHVPTGPAEAAVAGGQFGPVRRVSKRDPRRYPRETPATTAPAHRYVASVGAGGGLAVFAPGFFEYEHDAAGDLAVTLLRCVGQLSREDLPTRPGHAGWPTATPGAQCFGRERLQLAIAPVTREDLAKGSPLAKLWEDAFLPPRAVWLRQATALDWPDTTLRLVGEGLVFSSLKPATTGNGLVVRCYNATGSSVAGRLELGSPIAAAARVRADEREPVPLDRSGTSLRFSAGPHQIVTLHLTLSS